MATLLYAEEDYSDDFVSYAEVYYSWEFQEYSLIPPEEIAWWYAEQEIVERRRWEAEAARRDRSIHRPEREAPPPSRVS